MSKYLGNYLGPSTRSPNFSIEMPYLFIIKIKVKVNSIKVNSIFGAGWDTRNPCHNFNTQGPAVRILGLRVAILKSKGASSRVLGVRALCPRVPDSRVPSLRVPSSQVLDFNVSGSQGPGSRVSGSQGPRSQVQILDYAQTLMSTFQRGEINISQINIHFTQTYFPPLFIF